MNSNQGRRRMETLEIENPGSKYTHNQLMDILVKCAKRSECHRRF